MATTRDADPVRPAAPSEVFDVLIVGAGLSGIGAAVHLQQHCPNKSFAIVEARADLGGTWDLFRYPGIRSDSDMYTLGYGFKPWTSPKAIADGPSIKRYIAETAGEHGLDQHIRYEHRVVRADWSSAAALWTVQLTRPDGSSTTLRCGFLLMCAGYYDYAEGHRPRWAGEDAFGGQIVHPQFWPQGLDYRGKKVVVIGSGATAVTLAPEMARSAAQVTMLQRSPTYVVSRPAIDGVADWLKARLPAKTAYRLIRWKNVLLGQYFYGLARRKPETVKKAIVDMVADQLGPQYDVATHFTPRYAPWDQRLCAVPDADLFEAIRGGRLEVVTDTIETFTRDGVQLSSGRLLEADVVVTATGLKLNLAGDVKFTVDGTPTDLAKSMNYKGCMLSGVPNLALVFGYTNASWTLKADLTSEYICRLLNRMDARGARIVTPQRDPGVAEAPFLDFQSGYVQRALDNLPKQGSRRPWRLHQNYGLDLLALRLGRIEDGTLRFAVARPAGVRRTARAKVRA